MCVIVALLIGGEGAKRSIGATGLRSYALPRYALVAWTKHHKI